MEKIKEDINRLELIKELYENGSDALSGTRYSEFMKVVNDQINELITMLNK